MLGVKHIPNKLEKYATLDDNRVTTEMTTVELSAIRFALKENIMQVCYLETYLPLINVKMRSFVLVQRCKFRKNLFLSQPKVS